MLITKEQVFNSMPGAEMSVVEKYIDQMNSAMEKYDIRTPKRISAFIAQISHECNSLNSMVENLNYSADRLLVVFPKYFKTQEEANKYARKPEMIANYVYANRMGNGPESSGDGWRYRGRTPIHLTGKRNYDLAGKALQYDFVSNPDDTLKPGAAMMISAWYWKENGLNELADTGDFKKITKKINGGYNGLQDRLNRWYKAQKTLGIKEITYIEV